MDELTMSNKTSIHSSLRNNKNQLKIPYLHVSAIMITTFRTDETAVYLVLMFSS